MDEALAGAAAISEQRLNTRQLTQHAARVSCILGWRLLADLPAGLPRVICTLQRVTSAGLCVSGPTRSFAARFCSQYVSKASIPCVRVRACTCVKYITYHR